MHSKFISKKIQGRLAVEKSGKKSCMFTHLFIHNLLHWRNPSARGNNAASIFFVKSKCKDQPIEMHALEEQKHKMMMGPITGRGGERGCETQDMMRDKENKSRDIAYSW
jgi:hypothetical protein